MDKGKTLNTIINILGNIDPSLRQSVNDAQKEFQKINVKAVVVSAGITKVTGKAFKAVGKAAAGFAKESVNSAMEFESSFAGVKKTVDATEEEYAKLEKASRQMSKVKPVDVNDINQIMELGGQLGIQTGNLEKFSDVIADLDVATNMDIESASTQMAQYANITKMSQDVFDRFGSTIVDLGNNFATTEADIMAMAHRISGAGSQIGMTDDQILAMSTALSSVGIEAEAGGTAISTVMSNIDKVVATNGKSLSSWAESSGMSIDQFKKSWGKDAAGTMQKVFEGLGNGGENLNLVLEDLGVSSLRQTDMMKRMSGASDVLGDAYSTASSAWEDNIALTKEAEQRYGTTESKMEMLKNKINDVKISVGKNLIPALADLAESMGPVIEELSPIIASAFKGVADGIENAMPTIKNALNWVSNNGETVKNILVGIAIAMALAFAGGTIVKINNFISAVKGIKTAFFGAREGAGIARTSVDRIKSAFTKAGGVVKAAGSTIKTAVISAATSIKSMGAAALKSTKNFIVMSAQFIRTKAQAIGSAIAMRAQTVALKAQAVAAKVVAVAQRALNAVMKANPVMLIVTGILLLVGAFIAAYKKSKTFRDAINKLLAPIQKAWNKLRSFVKWLKEKFKFPKLKFPDILGWAGKALGKLKEVAKGMSNVNGKKNSSGGKGGRRGNVPKLASGGFTQGVSIAGEAGREAVISFKKRYRQDNISYWAKAGQLLGVLPDNEVSLDGMGSNQAFGLSINGITFAPTIITKSDISADEVYSLLKENFGDLIDDVTDSLLERWGNLYDPDFV